MTNTTVVHDTDSLLNLHRVGDSDAWDELVSRCRPIRFDPAALDSAAALYAAPRSVQDSRLSASDAVVLRDPHTGRRYLSDDGARLGLGAREGRSFTLTLGPGVASLVVSEEVLAARAVERVRAAVIAGADQLGALIASDPTYVPGDGVRSRFVSEWSHKSRRRMLKAFASVDFSGLDVEGAPLGMVTLTYPGDWLAVAPNGRAVKRHLKAFRQRYGRAVGRRLDGAWKLEFQRPRREGASAGQRAPHFHLLMPVPPLVKGESFESWLSSTWASIVGADPKCRYCEGLTADTEHFGSPHHDGCWDEHGIFCDTCVCEVPDSERWRHQRAGTNLDFGPTARSTDPKRLGVYFLKHGTKSGDDKEYQHIVPRAWLVDEHGEVTPDNGPGRFWGFWGLKPATVAVELDVEDFVQARRVLRKVAAARSRSITYQRARRQGASVRAAVSLRRGSSRVLTGSRMVGGFVVVNDGTRLAVDLSRALNLARL